MERIWLRWWGCGAFDVRFGDVNIAFDPYLFGENLDNAQPIYDYIFISHEHFDHCHPKTLRKLCQGERFKTLFVPPGALWPDKPIDEKYGDAAFSRDLPITKHVPAEKIQVMYPKHQNEMQWGRPWAGTAHVREFPGPMEVDLGALHVETIESGENQRPDLPNLGFLVTHKALNLSFLHIGDAWAAYPAMRALRGRVDFAIHMKLGLTPTSAEHQSTELEDFVDYIRPYAVIPVHYRTDRKSDPVPEGHWPPNASDVGAFIEYYREKVGPQTQVLPFTAGIEYALKLPEKRIEWEWEWVNTWDMPPWREG